MEATYSEMLDGAVQYEARFDEAYAAHCVEPGNDWLSQEWIRADAAKNAYIAAIARAFDMDEDDVWWNVIHRYREIKSS